MNTKVKSIDTKKLANITDAVGKEKAREIHLDIMRGILMALSAGQNLNGSGTIVIPISQEASRALD